MKISEHANNLLNEFGKLQFDFAITLNNSLVPERDTARDNLASYIAELEAERLELRKTLGWAYDLDEYKDNPEVQKMYNKFNQNHRSKNERQILQER